MTSVRAKGAHGTMSRCPFYDAHKVLWELLLIREDAFIWDYSGMRMHRIDGNFVL